MILVLLQFVIWPRLGVAAPDGNLISKKSGRQVTACRGCRVRCRNYAVQNAVQDNAVQCGAECDSEGGATQAKTMRCNAVQNAVRFGSVHLAWYEEALDEWTGPLTSRRTRKPFGS
jgi:hypothetical protein